MAKKTEGEAHTTEIGLYPPAATEMTNSDMMLMLMSCVVKRVIIIIKVSAKLYRYPVVTRAIQRDWSLATCPCGCVTPSAIMNLSTSDFYPNVTT